MTLKPARLIPCAFLLALSAIAAGADGPATRPVHPAEPDAMRQAHASLWGGESRGVQMRARGPREVEARAVLPMSVQFLADPDRLAARRSGTGPDARVCDRLDTFLFAGYVSLSLVHVETGESFSVRPHDPTRGMFARDEGDQSVPLSADPGEPMTVDFPLLSAGDGLKPGVYDCTVTYDSASGSPEWKDPKSPAAEGFWTGKVSSAPLRIRIAPETEHRRSFTVPTRLRLAEGKVRFDKAESEVVSLPVRNGYFTGMRVRGAGNSEMLTSGGFAADGAVVEDLSLGAQARDAKAAAKPGAGAAPLHYDIEIFETARPPGHMWMPAAGEAGYRTLWRRAFDVEPAAPRAP